MPEGKGEGRGGGGRQSWGSQSDCHLECPGGCQSRGMKHQLVPEGEGEAGSHGVVSATVTQRLSKLRHGAPVSA